MPAVFAIDKIFREYKDKVYRLALGISRNEKDAEDITQNAFLKIVKNLSGFKAKSQISTWIYKIAYNESLMHLRRKKSGLKLSGPLEGREDRGVSGLFVNWPKLPDEQLLDRELKERLDASIRNMPIKYRMPLLLDAVEELPLKESAAVMNLKVNSLKTRLHRAHQMLKEQIKDYFRDRQAEPGKGSRQCRAWMNFIYKYTQGDLGKAKTASFRKHIRYCRSCHRFLADYSKAIAVTRALECRDLPEELAGKIEEFLFKKINKKN